MESQNNYIENSQASNSNNDANSSQVDLHSEIKRLETVIAEMQQLITRKTPENAQQVINARNSANAALTAIKNTEQQATNTANVAAAQWKTVDQQVKSISDLKAQASTDASTVKQYCKDVDEKKQAIAILQEQFADLFAKKEKRANELQSQIEDLLPGATSLHIAFAFDQRKKTQVKLKWLWGGLLIVSLILIIWFAYKNIPFEIFGHKTQIGDKIETLSWMSFYARAIIFASLVFLEEFARKNFNIASRLEEAYAYKSTILATFDGYGKMLKDIKMPSQQETSSQSELVKIVLEKLNDEPGKTVFDKEKHEIGLGAIMDHLTNANIDDKTKDEIIKAVTSGKPLARINWQTVVIVGIVAVAACFIACLFKGQLI